MKRFLRNITYFTLIVGTLLWIPQILFDRRAHSNNQQWPFSDLNNIEMWKGDTTHNELLVSGNSRGGHYLVTEMQELYPHLVENVSLGGFPFDFQYYIMLKRYLNAKYHPRYIIQEICPFCFFGYVNPKLNVAFLPYIDRPELHFLWDFQPGITIYDRILPVKYRGNMDNLWSYWKLLGMDLQPEAASEALVAMERYDYDRLPHDYEHNVPTLIHLFDTFIQECDSLNIGLILAISPMHTEDGYPFYDWDSFHQIIDSLTENRNIPILDYSHFYGNDTTYFVDPVHLKQLGRQQYTRQIMHDLDSLGIISCQ